MRLNRGHREAPGIKAHKPRPLGRGLGRLYPGEKFAVFLFSFPTYAKFIFVNIEPQCLASGQGEPRWPRHVFGGQICLGSLVLRRKLNHN